MTHRIHEKRCPNNQGHKKRPDQSLTLTTERLENALCRVARLVADGRQHYLPIFLRLEKEVATCNENENAVRRALKMIEEKNE